MKRERIFEIFKEEMEAAEVDSDSMEDRFLGMKAGIERAINRIPPVELISSMIMGFGDLTEEDEDELDRIWGKVFGDA